MAFLNKMLNIHIQTIKHSSQRYPTCGDWYYKNSGQDLYITVSELQDWRKEILVAVHELIEVMLCKDHGITQQDVDKFDIEFEKNRDPNDFITEPGDDPKAPYFHEHFFATVIERLLAMQLKVDWKDYEKAISEL